MNARFTCASSALEPRILLRRGRAVWVAFLLALVVHPATMLVRARADQRTAPKPLTTQFVKRQPRLTKPLELKKRPQPKRRTVQREMVSVKARADRQQTVGALDASRTTQRLAHPRVNVGRAISFQDASLEPQSVARMFEGEKEDKGMVDMSLDMIDVDALDTGQYRAIVVQDCLDKRNLKGFLHLASAYPAAAWNAADARVRNEIEVWSTILRVLAEAMNRFTDIRTDFSGKYTFDSDEVSNLPFLYNRIYWPFGLSGSEALSLGKYLVNGGFLYAETVSPGAHEYLPGETVIKEMIKDALQTHRRSFGKEWVFERLANSHTIYHCYFDFDGPPIGTDCWNEFLIVPYLEGVTLGGRLLAVVSQKNYASPWIDWPKPHHNMDNTRQLQFGVNIIVFALTQEGSITHRLMESLR